MKKDTQYLIGIVAVIIGVLLYTYGGFFVIFGGEITTLADVQEETLVKRTTASYCNSGIFKGETDDCQWSGYLRPPLENISFLEYTKNVSFIIFPNINYDGSDKKSHTSKVKYEAYNLETQTYDLIKEDSITLSYNQEDVDLCLGRAYTSDNTQEPPSCGGYYSSKNVKEVYYACTEKTQNNLKADYRSTTGKSLYKTHCIFPGEQIKIKDYDDDQSYLMIFPTQTSLGSKYIDKDKGVKIRINSYGSLLRRPATVDEFFFYQVDWKAGNCEESILEDYCEGNSLMTKSLDSTCFESIKNITCEWGCEEGKCIQIVEEVEEIPTETEEEIVNETEESTGGTGGTTESKIVGTIKEIFVGEEVQEEPEKFKFSLEWILILVVIITFFGVMWSKK